MKISVVIPEEWAEPVRKAASEAGYKSVSQWLRVYMAQAAHLEQTSNGWGGKRQVAQDAQDAVVEVRPSKRPVGRDVPKDTSTHDVTKSWATPTNGAKTPGELLAERKREAAQKFAAPRDKK